MNYVFILIALIYHHIHRTCVAIKSLRSSVREPMVIQCISGALLLKLMMNNVRFKFEYVRQIIHCSDVITAL